MTSWDYLQPGWEPELKEPFLAHICPLFTEGLLLLVIPLPAPHTHTHTHTLDLITTAPNSNSSNNGT